MATRRGSRRGKEKKSITDRVSDVLVNRKINKDSRKLSVIRKAKAYDNAPDFNSDGSVTEAFKTRTMADKFLDDFRQERAAYKRKKKI